MEYDKLLKLASELGRLLMNSGAEIYRVVTGFGLDQTEYEKFTDEIWEGFAQRGMDIPRGRPYQIGITIGVHTGPTPIGVGLLKRAKRP